MKRFFVLLIIPILLCGCLEKAYVSKKFYEDLSALEEGDGFSFKLRNQEFFVMRLNENTRIFLDAFFLKE